VLEPVPDTGEIRLTAFSHGAGCACKLSPAELRTVLGLVRGLDTPADPNLLVGLDTADDGAVYRLRDDLAIVFTADFFTPIVDDPYDFGRVAATNALSDVYAMGAAPPALLDEAVRLMTTLNQGGRDAALEVGVNAATDVTGFGLLGHLREMLVASGLAARVDPGRVPVIDGVRELLAAGMVAGGTQRNHAFVDPDVDWAGLAPDEQLLLADAQTSGGLLLAVDPGRAGALVAALGRRGTPAAAVIGHTVEGAPGRIGIR
jgi:selenophosphate synthase